MPQDMSLPPDLWELKPEEVEALEEKSPPPEEGSGPERKPCPDCGKLLTWLADGSRPRQHKCVDRRKEVRRQEEQTESVVQPLPAEKEGDASSVSSIEKPLGTGMSVETAKEMFPETAAAQPPAQPSPSGITADLVIAKFIETRDEIAAIEQRCKDEVAKKKELQAKREAWLQGELKRLGVKSFSSDHGAAFIATMDSAKVADRKAFLDWVRDDWALREPFLENRVSKTAVKQMLEDGETPPPGVDYIKIEKVQIRRK